MHNTYAYIYIYIIIIIIIFHLAPHWQVNFHLDFFTLGWKFQPGNFHLEIYTWKFPPQGGQFPGWNLLVNFVEVVNLVVLSRLFLNNPDKTTKLTPLFPGCSPHLLILRMLSIWSFCQCCFFNNPDKTTKLTPLFPGCSPLLILRMLSIWSFCQCFFF